MMKDELRGIAIAFGIMGALIGAAYGFTAIVGPGPTSSESAMAGTR